MNKETFEKGKELEQRIFQLGLLKKHMESFLNKEPFGLKIEISILGQTSILPIPFINDRHETYQNYLHDSDDGKFIIQQL